MDRAVDAEFCEVRQVRIAGNVSGLGKARHREFAMASGEMNQREFTNFLRRARYDIRLVRLVIARLADDEIAQLKSEPMSSPIIGLPKRPVGSRPTRSRASGAFRPTEFRRHGYRL